VYKKNFDEKESVSGAEFKFAQSESDINAGNLIASVNTDSIGEVTVEGLDEGSYYFKIDSIKDYLSDTKKYKKLRLSVEDKHKEISERRNIQKLVEGLRKNIPGFEKAYVSKTSSIGIRESRTVVGDYFISGDDVFNHRDFPDTVVRGAYPSDIHDPKGGRTQFIFINDGSSYGIPYRCFLPKGIEGLLVAGRSISSTQKANGTVRLQGTVMAQGQAVGTAAALAVSKGVSPRNIDIQELRKDLLSQGAII